MTNFELDPLPYVPPGFEIIDGGPLCLPRTFSTPAVAPDSRHDEYAIGIVEPAPLPEEIQICHNMVSDFVVNRLERDVLDVQPWIQGVGLFRFRSAISRQVMVDHPPFDLGNDRYVRLFRMMRGPTTELFRVFAVVG